MYVLPAYMPVQCVCLVPIETRREHQITESWNYRLGAIIECWGWIPGPLEKHQGSNHRAITLAPGHWFLSQLYCSKHLCFTLAVRDLFFCKLLLYVMCMVFWLHVCLCSMCVSAAWEGQRGHLIHWNWRYWGLGHHGVARNWTWDL